MEDNLGNGGLLDDDPFPAIDPEPHGIKDLVHGEGKRLQVATTSTSPNLEHIIVQYDDRTVLIGLFDGHDANEVPKFCATYLPNAIRDAEHFLISKEEEEGDDDDDDDAELNRYHPEFKLLQAIKAGFLRMDQMVRIPKYWIDMNGSRRRRMNFETHMRDTGSTACVVMIRDDTVLVANAGLSSCIVSLDREPFALSTEHRPDLKREKRRVDKLCGNNERLTSLRAELNFTRGIGYFKYKSASHRSAENQLMTASPEVKTVQLKGDIECMVVASKGYWDVVTPMGTMKYIDELIKKRFPLSQICKQLKAMYRARARQMFIPLVNIMIVLIQLPVSGVHASGQGKKVHFKYRTVKASITNNEEWERLTKRYILARDMDKVEILKVLRVLRLKAIENGDEEAPRFTLPTRGTGLNVYRYEPKLEQVCLLRKTTYISKSVKLCKTIAAIMDMSYDLVEMNQFDSLRELGYLLEDVCPNQREAAIALRKLCLMAECTRTSLHMMGTPKGYIAGEVTLVMIDDNGDESRLDCNAGLSGGMNIPVEVEMGKGVVNLIHGQIDYILVLEKATVLQALLKLKFHIKNKCLLITGGGVPDIRTRVLVSKLKEILKVPVYCMVDCNPFGLQIYCTYKYGSLNLAFDGLGLSCSTIKLIGLFTEDLGRVKKSLIRRLSAADVTCADSLLRRRYVLRDQTVQQQLENMLKLRCKAQIEALQVNGEHADIARYIEEQISYELDNMDMEG